MLKLFVKKHYKRKVMPQPPSGGCVLKRKYAIYRHYKGGPAAFRRLCVETSIGVDAIDPYDQPPSGGCVLKPDSLLRSMFFTLPAAFRRLCVETEG